MLSVFNTKCWVYKISFDWGCPIDGVELISKKTDNLSNRVCAVFFYMKGTPFLHIFRHLRLQLMILDHAFEVNITFVILLTRLPLSLLRTEIMGHPTSQQNCNKQIGF